MLWARYSTRWYLDPKVLAVSPDAELLYARAIAYCKEQLTDGLVPRDALDHLGAKLRNPRDSARELTRNSLWLPAGLRHRPRDDFTFPPAVWEFWQGTRADVELARQRETERKRRQRARPTRPELSHRDMNGTAETRDAQPEPEPEKFKTTLPYGSPEGNR